MARGRILSKTISHSVKIARLYKLNKKLAELAVVLFSWSIAHTDDYGQLSADPHSLKLEVLSNSPREIEEIKEALFMLYKVNLIKLGICDEEPVMRIINFEEFQTFRSDRKRQNKYLDTQWDTNDVPMTYQWQSMVFSKLSEVKLSEVKLSEENTNSESPILEILLNDKNKTFKIFQDDIDEWNDTFPAVDILQTLKIIRQWNKDNPENRKTKKGIRKHISTWLGKEQNKAPKTQTNNDDDKMVF